MASKKVKNHQSPQNDQKVDRNYAGLDLDTYKNLAGRSKVKPQETLPDSETKPVSDAARLLELLKTVDVDELETALGAIKTAKEVSPKNDDEGYKFYKEKCLVYEDREAFIYQRPDRKKKTWYFRIYDDNRKKPVVKSLKTEDRTAALASARVLYIDIKGKIERGERLKTITPTELVELWLAKLSTTITTIPHQGITPNTFTQKRSFMRRWVRYLHELNLTHKTIDKINKVLLTP